MITIISCICPLRRGIKFEELCAGIQKANVATPTAPFPPTPTGMIMAAAATPRNSNTTDEPSASFPQDEGEVSTVVTTDQYRVTMVVANMPGWVGLTTITILVIPLSA